MTGSAIGPAGWLRIVGRTATLAAWLLICLALYPFGKPGRGRNPVSRWFLAGTLRIVGARLRVVGTPVSEPSILVANHLSWIDILALADATGSAFVAHDGLADNQALRFLCRLNRTVFIARNDRNSVAGQIDQVQEGLGESGVLTLFAEGTTNGGVSLLPFKSSLLAAVERSEDTVAIVPVWIDYGAEAATIAWAGDEPGVTNFQRMLARSRPIDVTVHLLAPLSPNQRRNRKVIATSAYDAIAERMDQRVTL